MFAGRLFIKRIMTGRTRGFRLYFLGVFKILTFKKGIKSTKTPCSSWIYAKLLQLTLVSWIVVGWQKTFARNRRLFLGRIICKYEIYPAQDKLDS